MNKREHYIVYSVESGKLIFVTDEKRPLVSYLPIWRDPNEAEKFVNRHKRGDLARGLFDLEDYLAGVEWHPASGVQVYIKPMDF